MSEEKKAHHHRSSLKQKNKPFKGSSRSKSRAGRIESKKKITSTAINGADLNRKDRRNRANLIQASKREELIRNRRMYSGKDGMPRIISVIPVTPSAQVNSLPSTLQNGTFYSESNKQNLTFLNCSRQGKSFNMWLFDLIEVAKVADCIVLLVHKDDECVDEAGIQAMAALRSLGISSSMAILQQSPPQNAHTNLHKIKQAWLSSLQFHLSCVQKIYSLEGERELLEMERLLCNQHLHGISWRDSRPFMLTEAMELSLEEDGKRAILKASGYARGGKCFSANRLVSIPLLPGVGFELAKVELIAASKTPFRSNSNNAMDTDEAMVQLPDPEEAERMDASEAKGDQFSPEAMMRAAEEMMGIEDDLPGDSISFNEDGRSRKGKLVPKGTSSYQAAWMDSADVEADADADDEEPLELVDEEAPGKEGDEASGDEMEMDMDEHQTKLIEHQKLQLTQRHFVDEIELDHNVSARTRLQKYRGVASLRTSTWDPNENLPFDYGRLFRFANFKHSRKVAMEENDSPFAAGSRVALSIRLEGEEIIQRAQQLVASNAPISIFGLLKHEQRQTLVNFAFSRDKAYSEVISNKQEMLAMVGFRRFAIKPILSEHTTNALHKMLRTVDGDNYGMVVGSIFAPVTFTPCPILLFTMPSNPEEEVRLIGHGSIIDLDPSRIILKRITLTGMPFKVHKRSAVVRFMFSNPQDVMWFKPVELVSRLGARGHIKESLGTHGYMKCLFDRVVFHHDTVAMHLYKRVFPKWTTQAL